jgi:hypothetical protein
VITVVLEDSEGKLGAGFDIVTFVEPAATATRHATMLKPYTRMTGTHPRRLRPKPSALVKERWNVVDPVEGIAEQRNAGLVAKCTQQPLLVGFSASI